MKTFGYLVFLISTFYVNLDDASITDSSSLCMELKKFIDSYINDTSNELKNTHSNSFKSLKSDFQNQLDDIRHQLYDTKEELNNKNNQLKNNKIDLDKTKNQLDNTINELKNTKHDLHNLNHKLIDTNLTLTESSLIGSIAFFARKTAPNGWLVANGKEVSRITYAALFVSIGTRFGSGDGQNTFKLPDLRGEFIRGWSNGRDVDSGRDFGTFQWGSIIPIVGYINGNVRDTRTNAYSDRWDFTSTTFDEGFEQNARAGYTTHGTTIPNLVTDFFRPATSQGRITTWNIMKGARPRNIALLACIKH